MTDKKGELFSRKPLDFYYDAPSKKLLIGFSDEEGMEDFIRQNFPGVDDVEIASPEFIEKARLGREEKGKRTQKDQEKATVKAKIAEIEKQLAALKHRGDTGSAIRLIREREALEKQLEE